jgi:NADH-quinone oxidoreductase subunit L
MVMAVGVSAGDAAMFHLFTHAFFKALLFLGAGAVIYACHHEQNIWKMGGLKKKMPFTFWTFAIGTAALVAVPLTSGFYSKESILEAALHANPLFFTVAATVAFLTTFYMVRLLLVAFFGDARGGGAAHAAEVPLVMRVPLAVLAAGSLIVGFPIVANLLQAMVPEALATDFHLIHFNMVFAISLGALVIGTLAAMLFYGGRESDPFSIALLRRKFYFDELYGKLVTVFQDAVGQVMRFIDDYLIGGLLVKGSANAMAGIGELLRRFQLGNLHGYAFLFGVGVIVIVYVSVFLPL